MNIQRQVHCSFVRLGTRNIAKSASNRHSQAVNAHKKILSRILLKRKICSFALTVNGNEFSTDLQLCQFCRQTLYPGAHYLDSYVVVYVSGFIQVLGPSGAGDKNGNDVVATISSWTNPTHGFKTQWTVKTDIAGNNGKSLATTGVLSGNYFH